MELSFSLTQGLMLFGGLIGFLYGVESDIKIFGSSVCLKKEFAGVISFCFLSFFFAIILESSVV